MHRRQLNFLPKNPRSLRLLQAVTFAAFTGSLAVGYTLVPALFESRATISDALSPSPLAAAPTSTPQVTPRVVTINAVTAVLRDQSGDTIRYFEKSTGRAFRIDLKTSRESIISDDKVTGFRNAVWSSSLQRAVIATAVPTGQVLLSRDFNTSVESRLDSLLSSPALSPDGTSIAFLRPTTDGASSLVVTDFQGENERQLLKTRADSISLYWKNDQQLSFLSQRSDRVGADFTLITTNGSLQNIISNKENLEVSWSPRGDLLLYSYFDKSTGISLWLWSDSAQASIPLSLATSASKCAWDPQGEFVICGVPATTSLPRDIPAQQTATNDAIEGIDFSTLTPRRIYTPIPGKLLGIVRPTITTSGNYFVFTNMFDEKLMSIPLGK